MKKTLSAILSFLMVLSLFSPGTLSFGAQTIVIGKYQNGAETWRQMSEGQAMYHTQFLLTMNESDWNRITSGAGITFTGTHYDTSTGKWIIGGITGGRFELEITDIDGDTERIDCPPTTETGSGTKIVRFETADFGKPEFQIEYGNSYDIRLRVYVGNSNTAAFESTLVEDLFWAPGDASTGCDKMYKDGKPLAETPIYIPEGDPYETPVKTTYYHSQFVYGTDFEAHEVHGKNLLLGIPEKDIPAGGNVGENSIVGANVKITLTGGKTIETTVKNSFGSFDGLLDDEFTGVRCYFVRIPVDPFPAAGFYPGSKVEIFRPSDGRLMFTGEIDLMSFGNREDISDILSFYGSGAETWENHSGAPEYKAGSGNFVTQFLLTVPKTFHEELVKKITYTPSKSEDGKFTPAKWEGGHFELNIWTAGSSMEGVHLSLDPATVGESGGRTIYRFETCEAGFQIQKGVLYYINLEIYIGDECAYEGYVYDLCWSDDQGRSIYCGGKPADTLPGMAYYHTNLVQGYDFENHATYGKNLLLGIPLERLPDAERLLADGTKVHAVVNGKSYDTKVASNFGVLDGSVELVSMDVSCYFVRIAFPTFPEEGYWEAEISFLDDSGKSLYSGSVWLLSPGDYSSPIDPGGDGKTVTLSSYTGTSGGVKRSDWLTFEGKPLLCVNVHGITDLQDLKYFTTEVYVTLDGTRLSGNRLHSSADGGKDPSGGYQALLRLDTGTPSQGKHTVQITVAVGGETLYRSGAFEVTYVPGETGGGPGDINGDGKVNAADRTYLARGLAGWESCPLPALSVCDLNGDGKGNAADRTYLARHLANWSGYTL